MERNEKIVIAATAVIAAGSATLFAIKRVQKARAAKQMAAETETTETVATSETTNN